MSKIILTLLSLILVQTSMAQNGYVYLEVDKNLPVEVRLNSKKIRNNNKGYIIIPKLNNGENRIDFNFNNPGFKQHTFFFTQYNNKSQGYKLKRVENNEFVLVDLVNRRALRHNQKESDIEPVIAAVSTPPKKNNEAVTPKAKKIRKERGVIEVLTADNIEPTKNKKKYSSKSVKIKKEKTPTINATTTYPKKTLYTDTPKKRRTYAMYEQRRSTAQRNVNKNKNYRKINREKRRAAKATKAAENNATKAADAVGDYQAEHNNPKINDKAVEKERRIKEKELKKQEALRTKAAKKKRQLEEQKKREEQYLNQKARVQQDELSEKAKRKEQKRLAKIKREKERAVAKTKEAERRKLEEEKNRLEKIRKREQELIQEKKRQEKIAQRDALKKLEEVNKQIEKDRALVKKEKEDRLETLKRQEQEAQKLSNNKTKRKKRKKRKVSDINQYISSIKKEIINPEPTQKQRDAIKYATVKDISPINPNDYISDRCPSIISMSNVNALNAQLDEQYDDQARLTYVKKNMQSSCYSTDHIISILERFETQNGKYKLVKELYPNIADQSNMPRLFNSFKFESYRKRISELGN